MLLFILYLCSYASASVAQGLTIPSAWLPSTSDLDRQSREALANAAATALTTQANPSSGVSASDGLPLIQDVTGVFAVLALQDYYSGNTTWSNLVTSGIQVTSQQGFYSGIAVNSDAIYWGLAYYYAYRTYKQQFLLNLAESAFNATYNAGFITPTAAASGTGAGRNVSFTPQAGCTSKNIAGGVFWEKDQQDDLTINAETIAPFMALAAYLFEQTNSAYYQQSAQLSLDFMLNHMWNGTVMSDGYNPQTCATSNVPPLTYDQAWFIEGVSVWANVTKNSSLTTFLETAVPSVVTYSGWTLQNGVIGEAPGRDSYQSTLKGIFVRGLAEARARNPNTDLAKYIETYIMVQYNSILNQARAPSTDSYTTSWFGPTNATFSATGNLAALDVLNAAFSFLAPVPASSTPGSSSASPSATNAPSNGSGSSNGAPAVDSSSSNTGAIAGGVVGGVGALALGALAFFLWRRRQRRAATRSHVPDSFDDHSGVAVEPFLAQHQGHDQSGSMVQVYNAGYSGASAGAASSYSHYSNGVSSHHSHGVLSPPLSASSSGILLGGNVPSSSFAQSPAAGSSQPLVTVGHQSKLQRMNAPYGAGASVTSSSRPPTSAPASSSGDAPASEPVSLAEIPNLINRLNTLLQVNGELPPQYESHAGSTMGQ